MWPFKKKNKPVVKWHLPEGTNEFLLPKKGTDGAMAFDLVSPTDVEIPAASSGGAGVGIVNTLVAVTLPKGYAMILGSRSGLAATYRLTVEGGWIDNDYRGMLRVIVYNHSNSPYKISAGDRIAQAMLVKVTDVDQAVSYTYPNTKSTKRGAGGLGSTGK